MRHTMRTLTRVNCVALERSISDAHVRVLLVWLCRYLITYFVPLLTILFYEARQHQLTDAVVRQLKDPMTYVELIAEIFLSNVMVSDLCYAQFFGQHTLAQVRAGR